MTRSRFSEEQIFGILKEQQAEAMLDNAALKEIAEKMVTPAARRSAVGHAREIFGLGERRACSIVGIARRVVRYRSRHPDDAPIRLRLTA